MRAFPWRNDADSSRYSQSIRFEKQSSAKEETCVDTPRNRVAVGLLLLLLGGVVGGLVVRDAFPAPQATPPLPAQPPDFERLSAKWAYPGAKVSGGRNGLIGYYALATTPDDIGKVAAHYQALVGRDIPVNGTSVGGRPR
jgi:hypothetical protein